jgi:Sulfatase-modifying factor enzyme 1
VKEGEAIPIVELAHETLLTHWNELQKWIATFREALLVERRVEISAREWQSARENAADELAKLKVDYKFLWEEARLQDVKDTLKILGSQPGKPDPWTRAFLRPERDRLYEELRLPIGHARRGDIGDRLAVLGDVRPGLGLGEDKVPEVQWCAVPGGLVSIEGVREPFSVNPFYIAKYPVTLSQFNVFADNDVYYQDQWWQDLPVKPYEHRPYPDTPAISNHPAQHVSWYQAVAFCRWLSARLGYTVRLPSEWEWQQAATGGRSDYIYPWGSKWDLAPSPWDFPPANVKETGGRLFSVGLYPRGASPVGALDMSGNMYEWCQNEYGEITQVGYGSNKPRTTRGGAYFIVKHAAREEAKVTARLSDNPTGYDNRDKRIRVCIRLACDQPPAIAVCQDGP